MRYKEKNESAKAAKELRRQNRLMRVRRPQSQPFLKEYLPWVLSFIENKNANILTKTRLKVAIVFLVMTGLRLSEMRNLTVDHILTLVRKGYMSVDLLKRCRRGHKVFLSKDGQSLLSEHEGDVWNLLFLTGLVKENSARRDRWDIEPTGLFLFSAPMSQGQKPLSRAFFTNQINAILRSTPEFLERGVTLTSHSLRRGYITALWKETQD